MEIDNKKVLISAIIVALVVLVSFNFEKLTGQATATGDKPTAITITSGKIVYGNGVLDLSLTNSYPNQHINFRKVSNQATRFSLTATDCIPMVTKSSNEYRCTASQQFGNEDLINGQMYYVQAENRYGTPEGNKAEFKFIKV